jgi:hypothetical protein
MTNIWYILENFIGGDFIGVIPERKYEHGVCGEGTHIKII